MTKKLLPVYLLSLFSLSTSAQEADPVLMTIAGKPITRSEFEYIYNKNQHATGNKQLSLEEYVQLFVNFKLKVAEAEALGLDTTASFRNEFQGYRQQVAASYLNDEEADKAYAQQQYDSLMETGEWTCVRLAHIFKYVPQQASQKEKDSAVQKMDSIYSALQAGADFNELARLHSDDKQSAPQGGNIGWVQRHRSIPEFEKVAFEMPTGTYSEPFTSVNGIHIIMKYAQDTATFANVEKAIQNLRVRKGLLPAGQMAVAQNLRKQYGLSDMDDKQVLEWADKNLEKNNPDFAHLMQEYRDGILLFDASKSQVWDKAGENKEVLEAYFNENKKQYDWDEPRFKGIVVHTKDKKDIKRIKKLLKKTDYSQWSEEIRKQFNPNKDSITVRAQIGIFTKGLSKYVDEAYFKGEKAEPMKDFPYSAIIGKRLKKGPESYMDVRGQVTADYQNYLEEKWIEELRTKYPVTIDKEILKTINSH